MIKIVVDANGLMAPFKHRFNIDSELSRLFGSYEIFVPKPIVGELDKLGETNIHARAAAKLARARNVEKTRSSGDRSVLELAKKLDAFILTNDKELMAIARKKGIKIIIVKETGRLAPEQDWMLF